MTKTLYFITLYFICACNNDNDKSDSSSNSNNNPEYCSLEKLNNVGYGVANGKERFDLSVINGNVIMKHWSSDGHWKNMETSIAFKLNGCQLVNDSHMGGNATIISPDLIIFDGKEYRFVGDVTTTTSTVIDTMPTTTIDTTLYD